MHQPSEVIHVYCMIAGNASAKEDNMITGYALDREVNHGYCMIAGYASARSAMEEKSCEVDEQNDSGGDFSGKE